jgi:hypothetical protein
MSPEQWRGEDVDARTDVWAIGLLLFELLACKHPLAPLSVGQLQRIADLDEPMPSLAGLRPNLGALASIVDRCLQKRPGSRYSSSTELLDALLALAPHTELDTRLEVAPFAGLAAFQETDGRRFYGRDRDIEAVVGRLERQRIVTIAGPSGGGKSSFVRAGIIPVLRSSDEAWNVYVVRPGRSPLAALTEAVGLPELSSELQGQPGMFGARLRERCRGDTRKPMALLFVDQFEELFTLASDASEREAFLNSLLGAADEASSPIRVIITVRSDFLGSYCRRICLYAANLGGPSFFAAHEAGWFARSARAPRRSGWLSIRKRRHDRRHVAIARNDEKPIAHFAIYGGAIARRNWPNYPIVIPK